MNKRVGKRVRKFLKRIPEYEWLDALRLSVNTGSEKLVQADYGTFSLGDNAFVDEKSFIMEKPCRMLRFHMWYCLVKNKGACRLSRGASNANDRLSALSGSMLGVGVEDPK